MKLFFSQWRFKFHLGFFLLCVSFFILFCLLGNWQVHRYHEKKNLQNQFNQFRIASPIPLSKLTYPIEKHQFQNVLIRGKYLNHLTLLLQNQFYHDQSGFDVITPVQIVGEKKLLLVDRGWVLKRSDVLKAMLGIQNVIGYIKLMDSHQFILGKNILETDVTPMMIQKIDIEELSRITHQTYYPFILRLNPSELDGFIRDWTIVSMMPERHMGYAIQWYLMAVVLCIAFFCFCLERLPPNEGK